MTTRPYPEKFYVLDRLDQHFEMMSQICQIHVEFHVAFVRFETKRNVVQDMTCMASFEAYFIRNVFIVVSGIRNNVLEHKSIVFNGGYQSSRDCQSQDKPTTDPGFGNIFHRRNVVFALYGGNMVQKSIPRNSN